MNTPEPCDRCRYCYWDAMNEDDPAVGAICKVGLPMGKFDCPCFEVFDEKEEP